MDLTAQDPADQQMDQQAEMGLLDRNPATQGAAGSPQFAPDQNTGSTLADRLSAPPPFSWQEVAKSPSMQGVPPAEYYRVKNDYWQQYVEPQGVSFDDFDSETQPELSDQLIGGLKGVLGAFEQTGGFLAHKAGDEDHAALLNEAAQKNLSEATLMRYVPKYGSTGVRQLLNLTDPGFWKSMAAQGITGMAAFGAGALGGGALGSAVGGPGGAFLGAILGAGGTSALQELGSAYQEYLAKFPGDEKGASNYAYAASGLSGVLGAASVAMGPIGQGLGPIKHVLLQFALQTGLAAVGNMASQGLRKESLGEDVDLTDNLVQTAVQQGLFASVGMAAAFRKSYAAAKAQRPLPESAGIANRANPDLPVRGAQEALPAPPERPALPAPEETQRALSPPGPNEPGGIPPEPVMTPDQGAIPLPEGPVSQQLQPDYQEPAGPPAPGPIPAREPPPPAEAAPAPMTAPEPLPAQVPPAIEPQPVLRPTREQLQSNNREALKRQVEEFRAKNPEAVQAQPAQEVAPKREAAPRKPASAPAEEPMAKQVRAAEQASKVESPDKTPAGPVSVKPDDGGLFLKGGTGPHSDTIMAMEGKWDATRKGWVVPESYRGIVKELTAVWNNPEKLAAARKTEPARAPAEETVARAVKSQAGPEPTRATPGTPIEIAEGTPGTNTFEVKYAPKRSIPTLKSMGGIWNDERKTFVFRKDGKTPGTKTPIRGAVQRLVDTWNAGEKPALARTVEESTVPKGMPAKQLVASGKSATVQTEAGRKVQTRYHVLDADQLVASHTPEGKANPAYPADLQPRERSRVASKQQIQEMATRLNSERLRESPMASEGAPIVGPDAAVESGNGRVLAIRQAYENGQGGAYRDALIQNAESLGLKRDQVEAVKHPVLVRVRQGEMSPEDRVKFTQEANVQTTAAMSPVEQAKTDAARMSFLDRLTVGENGDLESAGNRDFIKAFAESVPANERGSIQQENGKLSTAGLSRLRNAIFARAYGDTETLGRMMESTDNNVRNVSNGLLQAAPRFAKLREQIARGERYPIDPTPVITQAIEGLSELRKQGTSLKDFLSNTDMFGRPWEPDTISFMEQFEKDARSSKRIGEFLNRVAEEVDALGSPRQGGLLDEATHTPTLAEIADVARTGGQGSLLDQSGRNAPEGTAAGTGTQSAFAPTGAERQITRAELNASGERIFGKNGPEIRLVNDIQSGAAGEYDPASRVIRVAMNAGDPQAVLAHEALHDARAYLLSRGENAMLDRVFRDGSQASEKLRAAVEAQRYEPAVSQLKDLEERIAHAGQLVSSGKLNLDPTTNGILNRLWRTYERVRNWVQGAGYNTAEEFLRGVQQGKLAGREPGESQLVTPLAARLPKVGDVVGEARRTAVAEPPDTILDKILSTPFRMLPVHRLYAQAMSELGKWVPERIKAGIMDRYGETNEMKAARLRLYGEKRHAMREVQGYVEKMMNGLEDRNASRIAYQWLTTNDPAKQADLMARLPESSRTVLKDVKSYISGLGKEAVKLGQLSPETQQRNDMAYLHRTYAKYELDPDGNPVTRRLIATRILGDQYKRRGLVEQVPVERLRGDSPNFDPATAKGKIFQRFVKTNADGRIGRYAWVEDHGIVPDRFTGPGWSVEKDSTGAPLKWEARWDEGAPGKPRAYQMWRDYTPAEQKEMGVNDEAKYAVARTLFSMHHDLETGHYFRWIASNPEWAVNSSSEVPAGATPVEMGRRYKPYLPSEWVQVPNSEVPRTGGVKVYGHLADKWVPGPLWNEIRQISDWSPNSRWEWYDRLMGVFKVSKTALSPTTHVNNVAANFVMADWADLKGRHLLGALQDHIAAWKGDESAKRSLQEFEDSGASQGSYAAQELRKEILAPLEEALRKEMMEVPEGEAGDHPLVLTKSLHAMSTILTGLKAVKDKAVDVYQLEDNMFRYAAYKKGLEDGLDPIMAARKASDAFLDYDINAPWVNVARKTGLPFLAFTYRAIPKLNEIVQTKPWKIAKLAMVMGALNGVGYALSGGNEDAERAMMDPQRSGKIWGIMPRQIRMPWNGRDNSPTFLDISRFIPMGDLFNYEQTNSAIPILPMMVPGGPLELLSEFLLNKDSFTGSPITLESDTGLEKAKKVAAHMWKGVTPNFVAWPGSYAYDKVFPTLPTSVQSGLRTVGLGGEGPAMDPFGREYPALEAWGSALGIKIATYPKDMLELRMMQNANYQVSELQKQIAQLGKKMGNGSIDKDQFDSRVDRITQKMQKVMDDVNARLVKGQGMR